MGFVSYYRRFIPNFSKVAKPVNKLLQSLEGTPSHKKRFKVCWGPEQQEAFETFQRLCTESPILASADFEAPFVIHTDASGDGLGAVLSRMDKRESLHIPLEVYPKVKGIIQFTNWNSLH